MRRSIVLLLVARVHGGYDRGRRARSQAALSAHVPPIARMGHGLDRPASSQWSCAGRLGGTCRRANKAGAGPYGFTDGLERLRGNGVVIVAATIGRGGAGQGWALGRWPLRLSSFRIDRGWEGQAADNIQQRLRWVAVRGWDLDIRVYFGTQHPSTSLLASVQAELNRLTVPASRADGRLIDGPLQPLAQPTLYASVVGTISSLVSWLPRRVDRSCDLHRHGPRRRHGGAGCLPCVERVRDTRRRCLAEQPARWRGGRKHLFQARVHEPLRAGLHASRLPGRVRGRPPRPAAGERRRAESDTSAENDHAGARCHRPLCSGSPTRTTIRQRCAIGRPRQACASICRARLRRRPCRFPSLPAHARGRRTSASPRCSTPSHSRAGSVRRLRRWL